LGPGVEVLARLDGEPVLVRQGKILAGTFHPELTDDSRLHRQFVELACRDGAGGPGVSEKNEAMLRLAIR
jgi:glutamine amidotransferase PdxT